MDAEASPPHSKATSLPLPGSWSEISTELPEEGKCQHCASLAPHSQSAPKPPALGPVPLSELPYHGSIPVCHWDTITSCQWGTVEPNES